MSKRVFTIAAQVVIALALTVLWSSTAGAQPRLTADSGTPAPATNGKFRTQCGVSHAATIDPIVFPGQTNKSHMHTFFGNTGIDENSTAASIRNTGASTCLGGTLNRSAYWVPTLYNASGDPLSPAQTHIYYATGGINDEKTIQVFPQGLRIIAGSASATSNQPGNVISWFCTTDASDTGDIIDSASATIPRCDKNEFLQGRVNFPQCWNGTDLDSPDHSSHMAYPAGGKCPSSHPVAIPLISQNFLWRVAAGTVGWRLSSDAAYTAGGTSLHADWFDGWNRSIATTFVRHCINTGRNCRNGQLGNGKRLVNNAMNIHGVSEAEAGAPDLRVAGSDPLALPKGGVSIFRKNNGDVVVRGWAIDLNSIRNPQIVIRDGAGPSGVLVNKPTNKQNLTLLQHYPGYGRNKGFEFTIPGHEVSGEVCARVSNIKLPGYREYGYANSEFALGATLSFVKLGCVDVGPPPPPTGGHSWAGSAYESGVLRSTGYAYTATGVGRATVSFKIDGVFAGTKVANGYHSNNTHYGYGWDFQFPGLSIGNHTVCPTILNPDGPNTALSCKTVFVD